MKTLKTCLLIVMIHTTFIVTAAPVLFDDRLSFESQGIIEEFQDFESFNPDEFGVLEDNFVDGSTTYTNEGGNLLVGANTFVGPLSNTFSNDSSNTSVSGDIAGQFTMFGLDIAINSSSENLASLTLFTNLSSYLFHLSLNCYTLNLLMFVSICISYACFLPLCLFD